ncbi:TVP38/TMEM64 family protein [Holzapfeliella floricola]|uniref:TVP38/TMEM64 family membrane protein n=1 Tax=Holzapfeliella floricola DSM 23037 = JCM 16512 TaxID=1423744 RepID=A0A0R2DKL0_9LACO|nr:VTT domain-containing protein [Holzapfeliella floricola]KRN04671.1 hypothetical protein FC86_GL000120 [Holzapfeliella floricola DSM 23037 = JCM 16512]
MSAKTSRRLINIATVISIIIFIGLGWYWYSLGIFNSQEAMQAYLSDKQVTGPFIFILIQIIQVVFPVIPGGITLVVGVVFFGPFWGFWYNYIGIGIGSIINFFLARYYGKEFILKIVSEKTYNKYIGKVKNQRAFDWFFALAILFPVAPDDLLCLIAGLTKMSFKKFLMVIILLKPWTILVYSLALDQVIKWIMQLFGG